MKIGADHGVERAERLIQKEHIRIEHQGTHQAHPLSLASRELGGETAEPVNRKARDFRQLVESFLDPSSLPFQMTRHQRHIVARVEMRE